MTASSETTKRKWKGVEPEDRAAARRAQLIEACTDLMGTVGVAEISMRGVCREAGLTERYFYESFSNLDELLLTALETVVLGARDHILAAVATAPETRPELVRHVVAAFSDHLIEDGRRGRIMFVESLATPTLADRGIALITEFTGPIAATIAADGFATTHPDDVDLDLNSLAIFGAMAFQYRPFLDGTLTLERARFDEHVAQVIEQIAVVRSGGH